MNNDEHTYFLTLGLGPVQDFINTARSSRDLWFGSWLLSELSRTAAQAIVERSGRAFEDTLIFPAPADKEQLKEADYSVVNKVVALVNGTPQQVQTLMREVHGEVQDRLLQEWKQVRERIEDKGGALYDDAAHRQIADMLEWNWAAVPLAADESDYAAVRASAEELLAQRKVTRDFAPVTWGKVGVPKSSLDGARESVIDEDAYNRLGPKPLRDTYGVRSGERLCAVGLLKRLGGQRTYRGVFSTSHLAALPLLARWEKKLNSEQKQQARQLFDGYLDYLEAMRGLDADLDDFSEVPRDRAHPVLRRQDGQLLFEERLTEVIPRSSEKLTEDEKRKLKQARLVLRDFLQSVGDLEDGQLRRPPIYYGLLHADGDRMGAVIDKQKTRAEHRELSRALSEFAQGVSAVVNETHGGSLVYSGGDDVLALLPLHTALECVGDLQTAFQKALKDFKDADGNSPTLSAGLVVSHHLDSLSDALELARAAEKIAKKVEGKAGLAITLDKRGGAPRTVSGNWQTLHKHLETFIAWHRNDWIARGLAYEWHDLALRLKCADGAPEAAVLARALPLEAARILARKKESGGEREVGDEVVKELKDVLQSEEGSAATALDDLANELIVARIFAGAQDVVGLPKPSLETVTTAHGDAANESDPIPVVQEVH